MSEAVGVEESQSEGRRVLAYLKAIIGDGAGGEGRSPLAASDIRVEPALFQQRHTDEHHITELSRAVQANGEVEALTVLLVGEQVYLVDGHHRLAAYRRVGKGNTIPVRYFRGTLEEAVIESGAANSKIKLNMTTQERGDSAWRYVLLGGFKKREIKAATQSSFGTIATMRRVLTTLGADAYEHDSWAKARRAAEGRGMVLSEEEAMELMERTATDWADRLSKTFGNKMADRPQIAAMALATYFGRRLNEVMDELSGHLPDADEDVNEDIGGDLAGREAATSDF